MLDKCQHGIYKAGESIARYCTLCNPAGLNDRTLRGGPRIPAKRGADQERLLDAAEFMTLPPGARIAEAGFAQ